MRLGPTGDSPVTDDQPSVSSTGQDEPSSKVGGLSKRPEPDPDRFQVIGLLVLVLELHLFQTRGLGGFTFGGFGVGDETPDEGGHGEQDGGEEGRIVVPEFRDEGGGGEGSGRPGDLVQDVDDGVHPSELENTTNEHDQSL